MGVVSIGAGEVEAVGEGGGLVGGEVGDGDAVVVCGWAYAGGDGEVRGIVESGLVDEVASRIVSLVKR